LALTLSHLQEVKEVVSVVESIPDIDPAKTPAQEQLTGMDIIDIPYPGTNDYRNILNFIPGVQQDATGQPHLAGAETYQTLTLFDGFNVTQPADGRITSRNDKGLSSSFGNSSVGAEYRRNQRVFQQPARSLCGSSA